MDTGGQANLYYNNQLVEGCIQAPPMGLYNLKGCKDSTTQFDRHKLFGNIF